MRIVDFWHDVKPDGTKAGISFEFAKVPTRFWVKGGENVWRESPYRDYLNTDFVSELPSDLQSVIEPVAKQTANSSICVKIPDASGDIYVTTTPSVGGTVDKLWGLSLVEVYGMVPEEVTGSTTYNEEGSQYKLYADWGAGFGRVENVKADKGFPKHWILRSPGNNINRAFAWVHREGNPAFGWTGSGGVSPGFCL